MQILVTGSNGFIGKEICHRLLKKGHQVLGTGRSPSLFEAPSFTYLRGDLTSLEHIKKLVKKCDAVIHCAGKAGAWGSFDSFKTANVDATENLLGACKDSGVKRFINFSSPSIYFQYKDQFNLKEDDIPPKFSNAYAETKYLAEKKVSEYNSPSFLTVSLRPRGVIGKGDTNWLPRIIEMRKKNLLIQPGTGENITDFTSVENLVDIVEYLLTAPPDRFGESYNISNDEPVKLWDFIEDALAVVKMDGKRKRIPLSLILPLARANEFLQNALGTKKEPSLLPIKVGVAAFSMTLNIEKAKSRLDYKPRVKTEKALQDFSHWYLDQSSSP